MKQILVLPDVGHVLQGKEIRREFYAEANPCMNILLCVNDCAHAYFIFLWFLVIKVCKFLILMFILFSLYKDVVLPFICKIYLNEWPDKRVEWQKHAIPMPFFFFWE